MELSWLGIDLPSKSSAFQFPVGALAWVAGAVPSQGAYERRLVDVSLAQ